MAKMGRPTKFTPELGEKICAMLAGGYSLRQALKGDDMPDKSTVMRWIFCTTQFTDPMFQDFRDQYAQAREMQAEMMADEIMDISDDGSNDYYKREGKEPSFDGEHVQRSKLRVDARKWVASKLLPKKYGDKVQNEITGKDGGPIEMDNVSEMEIARRLMFVLENGADMADKKPH